MGSLAEDELAMMESIPTVGQTLAQLGVTTPEGVARLFDEVRHRFDDHVAARQPDAVYSSLLRYFWLGRKSGAVSLITTNWLKPSPPELKRAVGAALNELRGHVEAVLDEFHAAADAALEQEALLRGRVDLTLPGAERTIGTRHIVTQTFSEIERIFLRLGFAIVSGQEIETPYYNFEALNIPEHHPARDDMDTFYMEPSAGVAPGSLLLRTHTSPMQIRTMEQQAPPIRILVPGKVYRRDNPDATHTFMFHQVEGLVVDCDITFCDFRGTMDYLVRAFLGPQVRTRLRPSYFPFTEPSAEVDVTCIKCAGKGCRTCKQTGWIELCGAGMVDPAVYGFVGYDPAKLSGFAFGLGVDRLAMLRYGFELPILFQNDVRFLRQFP
jgi:phenylalanyl-tRNA synthetase alpha chain